MGSGKSTTAEFIADALTQVGRSVRFLPETMPEHPTRATDQLAPI